MITFTMEEYQFLDRLIRSFNDYSDDMFDSWTLEDKDKAQDLLIKMRKFMQHGIK